MATFENVGLAFQLVNNVHGLVRDMRDNAGGYKAALVAGKALADVRTVMLADADLYLTRIQWVNDVVTRNLSGVTAALNALGLAISEANSLKTTLTSVCNHTKAAALATSQNITTEADYILANVPAFERIY